MRNLEGRLARLEGAGHAPVSDLATAQRADLAGELRALLAAVPHEDDRTALLCRLDTGTATDEDATIAAGINLEVLRLVCEVEAYC